MDDYNLSKYNSIKDKLDVIYNHITEGIRLRSKCDWYEHDEKSRYSFKIQKNNEDLKIQKKNFLMMKKLQTKHI